MQVDSEEKTQSSRRSRCNSYKITENHESVTVKEIEESLHDLRVSSRYKGRLKA